MSNTPPIRTRRPTGLPSWPVILVAGVEKSGKTVELVKASSSDLIHRTFWIGCGEDDPDEYGAIDGADFEIVEHDGTYAGIRSAVASAVAQPPADDGRPNLIVFDSHGRFWALLSNMAQETMNERARKRNPNAPVPDDGLRPTPDLWNQANDRWDTVLNMLKSHQGPVLLTSRLELQMVVDGAGNPTKEKIWKPAAQKNLPYDVGAVIQMRASYPVRDNHLTGVRSWRYQHPTDSKGNPVPSPLPDDFTIDAIWRQLGCDQNVTARQGSVMTAYGDEAVEARRNALLDEIQGYAEAAGVDLRQIGADWAAAHNGQGIRDTTDFGGLEVLRDDLQTLPARQFADGVDSARCGGCGHPDDDCQCEPVDDADSAPEAVEQPESRQEPQQAAQAAPQGNPRAYEAVADLDRATSVNDCRKVWRDFADVRGETIIDVTYGELTVGQYIMKRQRELASAGQTPDHQERAAGEVHREPVGAAAD